jgi:2-polyprenyl-3-methyl-5-hydroxy-6-metoxy-1,4-benzoquinol methylase
MHYRVKGCLIRSENTAKPSSQASKYLIDILQKYAPMTHALDMGCGKLRYAVHLAALADRLTVVDSEIQLSRSQLLFGKRTTIRDLVTQRWNHARAINVREFSADTHKYDFVLCSNVLSAIPSNRARHSIIRGISLHLTARGKALFVCQYTNSFFFQQMKSNDVVKHADGFLKGTSRNASFYGLINPENLVDLVTKSKLVVVKMWRNDQSGYVVAVRGR